MRRSPLSRVSRRHPVHVYDPDFLAGLRSRAAGRCEARTADCTDIPIEVHHRKLRKHGGMDSPANCLLVCGGCHRWVHNHPAEAYTLGLLIHAWVDPDEVAS